MRISLVLNTAAMDPHAKSNQHRMSDYENRGEIVEEWLPKLVERFDEVVVAGYWRPGDGYVYVPVDPVYRDRSDALRQREIGARWTTGDLIVFTHDDHMPTFAAENIRPPMPQEWDILVPKRVHGVTGEEMDNGKSEHYMGGHTMIMTRRAWAKVPWTSTNLIFWDIVMTQIWKDAGLVIQWTDDLVHVDLEVGEDET